MKQWPHEMLDGMTTRSAGLTWVASAPTASTTPIASSPTRPPSGSPRRPLTALTAGPQSATGGLGSGDRAGRAAAPRLARGLPVSGRPVLEAAADGVVAHGAPGVSALLMARTGAVAHVTRLTRRPG